MSRYSGNLPLKVPFLQGHKLTTLVENRRVFTLEKCELNIFETFENAEKVPLKFSDLVITSMLRGKKIMHVPDKPSFAYTPGESLLWQANEWMVIDFPEATDHNPTQCIALTIGQEHIEDTIRLLNKKLPKVEEAGSWKVDMNEFYLLNSIDFTEAINKIIRVSTENSTLKDVFAEMALRELLLRLMQTQARNMVESHCKQMSSYHRFAAVILYIKEHIHEKISVDDLSKKVYMSKPHFFRTFKREFGISPVEFILQEKIKIARELLYDPAISVTDACFKSGFNSINFFIKTFKDSEHLTPYQFKKLHAFH